MNELYGYLKYAGGRLLVRLFGLKVFSYSSINEDNIIDWLTGYKREGTYIDIGANNPDVTNNTKLFYLRGWRGINIEPAQHEFGLLELARPGDTNYNCAIGTGIVTFFEGEDDNTGNTFDYKLATERHLKRSRQLTLKPLSEIFSENKLTHVDFISIDVEGYEVEVLKSNDWTKYQADVLCIEGSGYSYLKQFGYRKVFWDGHNSYYKLFKKFHFMSKLKEYVIDHGFWYKLYLKLKLRFDSTAGITKQQIAEQLGPRPVILEIGAHVGSDTVEMSVLWPQGKIYAFEPLPDIFKRLKFKTKNFSNIELIPAAVTDHDTGGTQEMFVSTVSDASSSLLKPKDHLLYCPDISFSEATTPIRTVILSDWLRSKKIEKIDLIWIDAQGMELNIFKSLGEQISNVSCIYTEVSLTEFYEGSGTYEDIKTYLGGFGFILIADDFQSGQLMGNALFKKNQ